MKRIFISKFFIAILFAMAIIGLVGCADTNEQGSSNGGSNDVPTSGEVNPDNGGKQEGEDGEEEVEPLNAAVYFHYKRNAGDYTKWQIWLWAEEGDALDWEGKDDFGVYYRIDLGDPTSYFYEATTLGYIYRYGEWEAKDKIANDRFVTLDESMVNENNEIHLYSFEGKETIYLDKAGTQPVYEIVGFMLEESGRSITFRANATGEKYTIYKNGEEFQSRSMNSASGTVALKEKFNLAKKDVYELEIVFDEKTTLRTDLNISNYYNSDEFNNNYIYNGTDLGAYTNNGKTTFKLWAPASNDVVLNLYKYGHPTKHGTTAYPGDDKPVKSYQMVEGDKGVWSFTADEDLTGYYYTYTVTNGSTVNKDVVDPYAFATGINGLRGYVVDFSKTNPDGWNYNRKRLYSPTELVVYELHIRDLTMDSTWNGTEANRGKFLGMCEEGTTYSYGNSTVTTGFDHIKELGVNAVQILPFFDASNKEQREDQYNWGYNPQNYNVLEGQYSTNPYDAECRIKEFKQMVLAYNNAGIEIIMDVVYNHMSGITGSSFHKILPGYYFRYDDEGKAWNGSGCGNEVASERTMVRKYIIESITFWAKEYNLSGFRFDLMALLDVETMNLISAELKKIDSNIVVYGEPWDATGGFSGLGGYDQAKTANVDRLNVGMFDDTYRDKIKGDPSGTGAGWVQGAGNAGAVVSGMYGLERGNDPTKQVNYVTCHDNYTLADKLLESGVSQADLGNASALANGLILSSQGITFIHAGAEILRSKPIYKNNIWTGKYSHNSYNLPDSTNAIKWDEKITNIETFESYKQLISINRNHKLFQFSTAAQCSNYKIKESSKDIIVVEISRPGSLEESESWKKVTVIYTNKIGEGKTYDLTGDWTVAFTSGNVEYNIGDTVNGTVSMGKYSVVILYQE